MSNESENTKKKASKMWALWLTFLETVRHKRARRAYRKVRKLERIIAKDAHYAVSYAKSHCGLLTDGFGDPMWEKVRPRFRQGEKAILKSPKEAVRYAIHVGMRLPPAEKLIAQSASTAYNYVTGVIKEPWPEGEDAIASDPYYAFCYAKYYIKGPWRKGHNAIMQSNEWKEHYMRFLKGTYMSGLPVETLL
ncbi:MAG: hypothetical protein VW715_07325 [Rhodospirillales bacterium]